MKEQIAVVLLSGGLDSFVLLEWAKRNYGGVVALFFLYNQNNAKAEENAVRHACQVLEVPLVVETITSKGLVNNPYTSGEEIASPYETAYVPDRNIVFLTMGHALAARNGYDAVLLGLIKLVEADTASSLSLPDRADSVIDGNVMGLFNREYAPDATKEFLLESRAYFEKFGVPGIWIDAPFINETKVEIYERAKAASIMPMVLSMSASCFNGSQDIHPWGRGCGNCFPCREREWAFNVFLKRRSNANKSTS